jgi:hypothetical protein
MTAEERMARRICGAGDSLRGRPTEKKQGAGA